MSAPRVARKRKSPTLKEKVARDLKKIDSDSSDAWDPPPSKAFRFVDKWPRNITKRGASKKLGIFCSLGSSNINVIRGRNKSIMLDCGIKDDSCDLPLLKDLIMDSKFISEATEIDASSASEGVKNLKWKNMTAANQERRRLLMNYLDNLVKAQGITNFESIIITSRDQDNWSLLPFLFFDGEGRLRNEYSVKCFIFHGHVSSYSSKFHNMLEVIKINFPFVPIYSTASSLNLNSVVPLSFHINNVSDLIPKMYFAGLDKLGRSSYVAALTKKPVELAYQRYLEVDNNIRVCLPVINVHLAPTVMQWRLPHSIPPNHDVLPIAVYINRFSALFMGDATTDIIDDMLEGFKEMCLESHFDIIVTAHNGSDRLDSFKIQSLCAMSPYVVISPSFEKECYPRDDYIHTLAEIPSITSSIEPHQVVYYAVNENNTWEKTSMMMTKHCFSLHVRLTSLFVNNTECLIRQNVS